MGGLGSGPCLVGGLSSRPRLVVGKGKEYGLLPVFKKMCASWVGLDQDPTLWPTGPM